MSEPQAQMVDCPVVVLSLREAQINNETTCETLRDQLLGLYLQSAAVHAILDLRAVTYLSSAGFAPLLSLNRQVRERGGRLVLCNLRPEVEEIFTVTRLVDPSGKANAAFLLQPTLATAVTHLCESAISQ
jgi:anti-sigma B factor antagonist